MSAMMPAPCHSDIRAGDALGVAPHARGWTELGLRLLVAGWQGQVARAIAEAAPSDAAIAACALGRPALDICETRSIERALSESRADVIINAAGYTAVDQAEGDERRCFALNRDGARLLAEAAARRGAPIIHVSTDYVFDGRKGDHYVEDDEPSPATVYGRSKLAGEEAVRAANPRHVIIRTAWLHGPSGKNFVKKMLALAAERDAAQVVADRRGSPTYVPHFVHALLAVARRAAGRPADWPGWGIVHAAGDGSASWFEMAGEIMAQSARRGGPVARLEAVAGSDYGAVAPRPANSALACDRLEQVFGLRLPPWRQGLGECVSRILSAD